MEIIKELLLIYVSFLLLSEYSYFCVDGKYTMNYGWRPFFQMKTLLYETRSTLSGAPPLFIKRFMDSKSASTNTHFNLLVYVDQCPASAVRV